MSFFVSEIFDEKPAQWGLRGDPYLWDEMQKEFSTVPIVVSVEMFREMFYAAFAKLTNASLMPGKMVYCPEYAHGGMSSGKISGDFWTGTVLPLLLSRLEKYHIFRISNNYVVWKWDEKQSDVSKLSANNLWILDRDCKELWNIAEFFGRNEMCTMVRLTAENQFYFYTFSGLGVTMQIDNDEIKCVDKKLVR